MPHNGSRTIACSEYYYSKLIKLRAEKELKTGKRANVDEIVNDVFAMVFGPEKVE